MTGVVLDNTDGQYARATNQTSSLGGLYDLFVDFLFYPIFYGAIAVLLWQQGEVSALSAAILTALSVWAGLFASSIWALVIWRENQTTNHSTLEQQKQFLALPHAETQKLPNYQTKLRYMLLAFKYTWRATARMMFWLLPWRAQMKYPVALHAFALGSYGQLITLSCAALLLDTTSMWALITPVPLCVGLCTLLALNETD